MPQDIRSAKKSHFTRLKRVIPSFTFFVLLILIPLVYHYTTQKPLRHLAIAKPSPFYHRTNLSSKTIASKQHCDISKGIWVPNLKGSYYTNSTKCTIDDRQNCMKFGRPDTNFLKWRWKPNECELPLFEANRFLELVRSKSMAFIGDSVGRNQLESLMCLLASVATPINIPHLGEEATRRWLYKDYEFMVALIWTPTLVKLSLGDPNISSALGVLNLYLDEVDELWASQIKNFDYVIISSGHWFSRPLVYHEKGKIIGCHKCKNESITEITRFYGYRMVLRTTFRTILSLSEFKGMTIFRTFSPTHFGNEDWAKGGNCSRKRPYTNQEMNLESNILEFYLTQVDEFRYAEREGEKKGLRFKMLDVTRAMGMRPDGHPYIYGHAYNEKESVADCLHWCLPGPIDLWNELLLHILEVK